MDLGLLVAILLVAFIFVGWLVFAETVKVPEKFSIKLDGDTLTGIDIYDSGNNLLYSALYEETGNVHNVVIEDCSCFVVYWESEKIKGIGQFKTKSGTVYPKIYGSVSSDVQHCHNSEDIRNILRE